MLEKRQLFARANRILHSDIDLESSSHSGKALWSLQGNRGRRTLCGTHVVLFLRPVAISQSTKFRAPEPKALLLHTATSTDVPNGMKHFVRTPLSNSMDGDFDTGNVRYKSRERYSFGWSDPLGMYASPGA